VTVGHSAEQPTGAVRDVLDELRLTIAELRAMAPAPPIRSIHMHPDDVDVFAGRARLRTMPEDCRIDLGAMGDPKRPATWTVAGIPVYVSRLVPKGRPYIDPPEAGRVAACRAHEDCRAHRELGLACAGATRAARK
jgi:hypothetical protein